MYLSCHVRNLKKERKKVGFCISKHEEEFKFIECEMKALKILKKKKCNSCLS